MVRVANDGVILVENMQLSRNGGLCVNKASIMNRANFLESYCGWKLNYPTVINRTADCSKDPFFRIIVPVYNGQKFLERCI